MRRCVLLAVGLAGGVCFGAVDIGGLPGWETLDTEVSTNVPFALPEKHVSHLVFSLSLAGTPSNNVQVAFGRDANANGVLETGETELEVGWDCGAWIMRSVRNEGLSASYAECRAVAATTNQVKTLDFDLSVSRACPTRLDVTENGMSVNWDVPGVLLRRLYDCTWDTLNLTVRGVDEAEASVRARVRFAGTCIIVR